MTTPAVIFIVLGLVTQPKIDHILIRIGINSLFLLTQLILSVIHHHHSCLELPYAINYWYQVNYEHPSQPTIHFF